MNANWDAYSAFFDDGIVPASDIVSTVFIIGFALVGLYIAKWMYSQLRSRSLKLIPPRRETRRSSSQIGPRASVPTDILVILLFLINRLAHDRERSGRIVDRSVAGGRSGHDARPEIGFDRATEGRLPTQSDESRLDCPAVVGEGRIRGHFRRRRWNHTRG